MNANIPVLFRTYQSREIHPDCKIWEAARATSATPTLFKRIEIGGQPFIDGGLGHNNPSRLLLDEAKGLFGSRSNRTLVEHWHWYGQANQHQEAWGIPYQRTISMR